MTQDNGARALAERLDGIGQGFDGCEYAPVLDVDTARMDDLHHGPEYADAILANGAAFLPDAAELDRLRAALAEIAEGTEPDRIGQYGALRDWVHRTAHAALAREGSAGTACRCGTNVRQGIRHYWCLTHDAEWMLSAMACARATEGSGRDAR